MKLAGRRWWYLMPVVFITYSLAYLARANYGFAAAAGMAADLHISKELNALIGSLFFLGYFSFQIPGAIYAQNRSVRTLVFWSLILWGSCATLTGIVRDASWLLAIRFILGVVEAAVLPAMLILLANWFTRSERSRANTFLILGNPVTILWMSVLSGYLVQALNWRWMFIIEGVPAVIWAGFWWRLVRDQPRQAHWLSAQEQEAIEGALAQEQAGMKPVANYAEAFRSPRVLLLCVQYFCWSIGVYGFVLWLPSILKEGSSIGIVQAGWLSAVPYVLAIVSMLGASWLSDKLLARKVFVWPSLLVGAAGILWLVPARRVALLAVVRAAGHRRRRHVRALRTVLRPDQRDAAEERRRRSHGADQQHGGPRLLRRLLPGRLSECRHGQPGASYVVMAGALVVAVIMTLLVRPESPAAPARTRDDRRLATT